MSLPADLVASMPAAEKKAVNASMGLSGVIRPLLPPATYLSALLIYQEKEVTG